MSGTRTGGLKAAKINKDKDPQFYIKIGKLGGQSSRTGGFASTKKGKDGLTGRERASKLGKIGGRIGKRGPKYLDLPPLEEDGFLILDKDINQPIITQRKWRLFR